MSPHARAGLPLISTCATRARGLRRRAVVALCVLLAVACAACGGDGRDVRWLRAPIRDAAWVEALNGALRVRTSRALPGAASMAVQVAWTNRTARDYTRSLEIQCIVLREDGSFVSSESADFFPRDARILPGFEGTLPLELPLGGQPASAVSCSVTEAR